jgi:hypothetical protein
MPDIGNKENMRIRLDENDLDKEVVIHDCTNCTIEDETFTFEGNGDQLELRDCVDCKILGCTFQNRHRKGNFIHIKGEKSKDNHIEGCTFKNHTHDPEENGGEAIIVGAEEFSGCRFVTTIRKCDFINCRGDDEMVSIKSCDNIFEHNRIHSDCRGNVSIRMGGFNKIRHNVFEGPVGGIRVLGYRNEIIGNYHMNNDNEGDNRRPLIIENGNEPKDHNFREEDEPKGHKGGGHDDYAQAKKNIVKDNIYENCKGICVVWGRTDKDEKPEDNEFRKNIMIAEEKSSEFLKFVKAERGHGNTFEDNIMYGKKVDRGELREKEVDRLESPPVIKKPNAGH